MKALFERSKLVLAGVVFSILWASASAATKIGLLSTQPFILAVTRFAMASVLMIVISHLILRKALPRSRKIWKQLVIYGCLNVGLYLGLYVLGMMEVSAGLGTLFVATNPVLITLMATVWYRQAISPTTWISLVLCLAGLCIVAYPLLGTSHATIKGLWILLLSMLSYSAGALYYAKQDWDNLHILTINGWQTLIGGLILLPFLVAYFDPALNSFDMRWLASVVWLAIPVSIFAVLLWLYLLKKNPIKASFWLFLCPVAGFVIANVVMDEPISMYTFIGLGFVIFGLYLTQRKKHLRTEK